MNYIAKLRCTAEHQTSSGDVRQCRKRALVKGGKCRACLVSVVKKMGAKVS